MSGQKRTAISSFISFCVMFFIFIHVLHIYNFYCIIFRRADSLNL